MSGCRTSHATPAHNASNPVMVNISGNAMEGPFAPRSAPVATVRAGDGLIAADMGIESSIGLLLGYCGKTALFKLRIQMHGPAVCPGAQFRARRQGSQAFQDFDQRLRRF